MVPPGFVKALVLTSVDSGPKTNDDAKGKTRSHLYKRRPRWVCDILFLIQRDINVRIPTSGYGHCPLPGFETRLFQLNFMIARREFKYRRRAAHLFVIDCDLVPIGSGF